MSKKAIKEGFEKRTVHTNPKPVSQKPSPGSNKPPSSSTGGPSEQSSQSGSRND